MRHHQQVDEDESNGVGGAHVAEGFVGDLPLAVPLVRVAGVGVRRLADEVLGQAAAIRCLQLGEPAAHLEHAVERTVRTARDVPGHVLHGQQVLVVNGLFAHRIGDGDQLAQRHGAATAAAYAQLQQRVQAAVQLGRELDECGHRVAAAVVQPGGGVAREAHAQRARHGRLRHAQARSLGPVHQQQGARCVCDGAVINVDHAGGALEHAADLPRQLLAASGVGAVDLGDDGREYRRAGRHFNHLHVGAKPSAYVLQRRSLAQRNAVALLLALRFVEQVDLDVAHFATGAQVVLAHQAVEVDGRGGAGVGLEVLDLGHRRQMTPQRLQHGGSPLQRRAHRHVDHHLQFALVVERQHLQDDRAKDGQQQRNGDQQRHRQAQQRAITATTAIVQQGPEYVLE